MCSELDRDGICVVRDDGGCREGSGDDARSVSLLDTLPVHKFSAWLRNGDMHYHKVRIECPHTFTCN